MFATYARIYAAINSPGALGKDRFTTTLPPATPAHSFAAAEHPKYAKSGAYPRPVPIASRPEDRKARCSSPIPMPHTSLPDPPIGPVSISHGRDPSP